MNEDALIIKEYREAFRKLQGIVPPHRQSQIFITLVLDGTGEKTRKNEMIAIKVLELIVLCDRFFTEAETLHHESIYNNVVEDFNELIRQHYSKERSVGFYAKALNIHPNHLNALVKKYAGLTAKETIDDHILTEAKFLLHSSALTIKEISYELGFSDPDQFSSFFRRRLNQSPSGYKLHP